MATSACVSCGRPADPTGACPHCGHDPLAVELGRLDRDIADMSAQDMRLQKQVKDLAAKMQAAQHQRVILTHTQQQQQQQQRRRGTPKPRVLRTRTVTAEPPHRPPPGEHPPAGWPRRTSPPPPRPPGGIRDEVARDEVAQDEGIRDGVIRPEASSTSVQDLLLILGALLLAVAAVVFGVLAGGVLGGVSRAAILLFATVLMLAVPGLVARRALFATAETIAAVGLMLLPLDGYTLWTIGQLGLRALPGSFLAGLVCATTVVVAAVYMTLSGLTVPRFAIVLASQPVLPLLAYHWITGAAGWALAFAAVAAVDASLGGMLSQAAKQGVRATSQRQAQLAVAAATVWLRELTWVLHGLALAGSLLAATVALVTADSVPAALRGSATLLLAAAIGGYAALQIRRRPLPDMAAGLITLALVAGASRVAAVALPGRALLLIAAAVALTGLGVRALPDWARRGPQLASAFALALLGVVIAGAALRAGLAAVRSALPAWHADLADQPRRLADAVGPAGWQLLAAAVLFTAAAFLALPSGIRREGAVVGAAITGLAAPASLGLDWVATPWLLIAAAVMIAGTGLSAGTVRAAATHTAAAGVVGVAGGGAALARTGLTAAILTVITLAGALIAVAQRLAEAEAVAASRGLGQPGAAKLVGDWAAGAATFALPGAVAAGVSLVAPTTPMLAIGYLAVCVSLGYAAINQVAHRQMSLPLAIGSGSAAVVLATAAFRNSDTTADTWVAALLLAGAVLLFLAPSINATRRADRILDGPDIAAGVVTAAMVAALARIGALVLPGSELATGAALVLVVSAWVRALPRQWRRGPILGCAAGGVVIAAFAGSTALRDSVEALSTPGRIWAANLDAWPAVVGVETNWQSPVALLLLAAAAAVVLPRPSAYYVATAGVGLATLGAPVALGLVWWSPIAVGGVVATAYGIASVLSRDPRAGMARAVVAAVIALHAAGAGLVRPWTTAVALSLIVLLGATIAVLATLVVRLELGIVDETAPGGAAHLPIIGGAAAAGALLALPGAVAATAVELGHPTEVVLTAMLAASSIGLAIVAAVRRQVPQYLGYATVGVAGGATVTAVVALPAHQPAGLYAATAVLLGVIAELQRAEAVGPDGRGSGRSLSISPARGALTVSALPTALALAMIVPALLSALADPYQTLNTIWDGPPTALLHSSGGDPASAFAALLLTIAAALAAVGFTGGAPSQAIPVILPGLAITLLIAPVALGIAWPAATLACLTVFAISSLGVALTPPPPDTERARPARTGRSLVFVIGLMAGGAGLAGSLASKPLTVATLGAAVCVGAAAALGGRTRLARILGWLFAAASAQGFVLTVGLVAGLPARISAFGVLATGAALLAVAATLPRLRRPESYRETATVEWSGYAAALLALALAIDSPVHVAALLAAWGAVLGLAATRPNRQPRERRTLFWTTVGCEVGAWWLMMRLTDVVLIEAYTLPFAALTLAVGALEARHRPELSSWAAYGPALIAAFLPTLTLVLVSENTAARQVLLLLGAVAVLIAGSMRRQQAPVVVGAVVTAITALRLLTEVGPWLVLIPVGLTLLTVGANYEKRRRDIQRLRATLTSFR